MIRDALPSMEQVRLVSSGHGSRHERRQCGTCITKRDGILKFEGCYHGHSDYLLQKPGPALATLGIPGLPGGTLQILPAYLNSAL